MRQSIVSRQVALVCGLFLCFGSLFALSTPWILIPTGALFFLIKKEYVPLMTGLFLLPLLFFSHVYWLPSENTPVEGRFLIHSIEQGKGFSKGWAYRGSLHTKGKKTPCTLFSNQRYRADCVYGVKGFLNVKKHPFYTLKLKEEGQPLKNRFTLAELRFRAKEHVKKYIAAHIQTERAALFLSGMATGQLDDQVMKMQFNTLGVSHIMAISGLHFALITLALHFFLRLFLPSKVEAVFLIFLLLIYYLFIGDAPSVQRAWAAATVFLVGHLVEKRPRPLNSLGVALIATLLLNPLSSCTLGFQLSFLATGAILLLFRPVEKLLRLWLPRLPLETVLKRSFLGQHAYIACSFFREALALTLAVHVALLPLLLHMFHTFSLNGLFYNLFFPLLAGWALLLLLISLPFPFLHSVNSSFCTWLLEIAEAPPLLFTSFTLELHPSWVAIYLTLLGVLAFWLPRPRDLDLMFY